MPTVLSQVETDWNGGVPADASVNDVYHTIGDGIFDPSTDYQNHADQVRDCFSGHSAGYSAFTWYQNRRITVKVYDLADTKPRPERAVSIFTPASINYEDPTHMAAPQVCLCLSYYAGRNIRGKRSRIYIGPFGTTTSISFAAMTRFAPTIVQTGILELGHSLFDVGGENVAHVIQHTAGGTPSVVTNYWVDDRWDTQRRRLPKATGRLTLAP
jgi:hypothetical protein